MTQLRNIPTKAYVVDAKGAPFMLRDVILDEVREHEVLVEIKYTGICHTVRLNILFCLSTQLAHSSGRTLW